MDCIVTAGGLPGPEDPLYEYTQGKPKALLDMGGRTMLERVMDALQSARHVDRIVLVGANDDEGAVLICTTIVVGRCHGCQQLTALRREREVRGVTGAGVDDLDLRVSTVEGRLRDRPVVGE